MGALFKLEPIKVDLPAMDIVPLPNIKFISRFINQRGPVTHMKAARANRNSEILYWKSPNLTIENVSISPCPAI
jgi:hypothetical protein